MPQPKMFSVLEHFNGFSVQHNPTGKTHWLSDGVDAVFDTDDKPIPPGSTGFTVLWEDDLNRGWPETLEAYFPEEARLARHDGKVVLITMEGDAIQHVRVPEGVTVVVMSYIGRDENPDECDIKLDGEGHPYVETIWSWKHEA
jgi:hypothetical protein